ncbi:MAG: SDR family NAD(P)-dependent oxidoreductase, partial [Dehalococcoidia bacterium]
MGVLESKVVLITGGTGSFGQRAVARFLDEGARKVIIYSRDEYKQSAMRSSFKSEPRLEFRLGDVRDCRRLTEICEGVDHIIHAAAMKQVPSCEENPLEAVLTNVMSASNVIEAATQNMVEKVVNLSADKAVYSTSVYGATKFLSERLFIEASRKGRTRYINLRYSNVLDSRGSVFEVFSNRLLRGEAVSVFDAQMTRFFLTQDQVVELCLLAFENGVGGETYIKLAPPVNILKLAEIM